MRSFPQDNLLRDTGTILILKCEQRDETKPFSDVSGLSYDRRPQRNAKIGEVSLTSSRVAKNGCEHLESELNTLCTTELETAGFTIVSAAGVSAAIKELESGNITAVVLDVGFESSFGVPVILRIRREFPHIPVVVLTDCEGEATTLAVLRNGAQDCLIRDHTNGETLKRSLQFAIERQASRRFDVGLRDAEAELLAARQIQVGLIPKPPPRLSGFDLGGAWQSAQATCGDYLDFFPFGERYWGICVGDVCGHGLGPALVMAETRACLRTLVLAHTDVGEILTLINQRLAADLCDQRFVTLFFARLDIFARSLSYAGAGHQGYLINAAGEVEILRSTSMPLGLRPETLIVSSTEIALQPGDIFIAVTDGIEESSIVGGEMLGREPLFDLVRERRDESAQRIADGVIRLASLPFSSEHPQDDDFTAVVLKVLSE